MCEWWLALDPEQEPRGIGTSAAAAWRFACPAEWASDLERWPTVAEGLGWRCLRVEDAVQVAKLKAEVDRLRAALERYVAKFGNCGAAYDQAKSALAREVDRVEVP